MNKKKCKGLMNENECWEALNEMKTLKSPGSDGMSTEFYIFWKDLKKY